MGTPIVSAGNTVWVEHFVLIVVSISKETRGWKKKMKLKKTSDNTEKCTEEQRMQLEAKLGMHE